MNAFGGRDRVGQLVGGQDLTSSQRERLVSAMYQFDLQNYTQRREAMRQRELRETQQIYAARGSAGVQGYQALGRLLDDRTLSPWAHDRIRTEMTAVRRDGLDRGVDQLSRGTGQAAFDGMGPLATGFNLTTTEQSAFAERIAGRMIAGDRAAEASTLRALDAGRVLDDETRTRAYTPLARALRSFDLSSSLLDRGDGAAAARFLETQANGLRDTNDRTLAAYRDTALARAAGYRAGPPAEGYQRASEIMRQAGNARRLGEELGRGGATPESRFLAAMSTDSVVQAQLLAASAGNTDSLIGRGLVQTYRQMVDASWQRAIDNTGTLFGSGRRDALVRQQGQVRQVFDHLDTMMREQGIPLHTAWMQMFDNHRINSGVGGFPTAGDAARFLRDNEHSLGLLIPFTDMSRGFHTGDTAQIERARVGLVSSLRDRRQWDIADQLHRQLQNQQQTPEGRQALDRIGTGRGQWWGQVAGDFVERELPLLVLTGIVTGGTGWAARAGVSALGWSARAARGAQLVTELGAFVPTQRVLGELVQGRRADWSPGALARDYALTLGGYGLFRGMGAAWRGLRGDRLGAVGRQGAEEAFMAQGAVPRAAAGPRQAVPVVANPTGAEAAEAARMSTELRRIGGMVGQRPQDVEAALAAMNPRLQVNWGAPAEIGRSQLGRIQQYADDLVRANPGMNPQQALDLAAADFMNSGHAINYFRDPATGVLNMPRGLNYYGTAPANPAVEAALLRAHNRMLVEEYAHGAGYSIRPGSYVPLDPRLNQFPQFMQNWLADPANRAALTTRYGRDAVESLAGTTHEADIMGLLGGMNPFEVDRYPIRAIMEAFLRGRP